MNKHSFEVYSFVEPSSIAGTAITYVTREEIIKYMKDRATWEPRYSGLTDEQLVDEFLVVNWCNREYDLPIEELHW